MEDKPTFGQLLGRGWWFILIVISSGYPVARNMNLTGSAFGDFLAATTLAIGALFIYWLILQGKKP